MTTPSTPVHAVTNAGVGLVVKHAPKPRAIVNCGTSAGLVRVPKPHSVPFTTRTVVP